MRAYHAAADGATLKQSNGKVNVPFLTNKCDVILVCTSHKKMAHSYTFFSDSLWKGRSNKGNL